MSTQSFLLDDAIPSALRAFATEKGSSERLAWWLLGAHSSERWLQFELAFQLHRYFEGRYVVLCEQQRRDIVIVQRQGTENIPVASLEFKWFGNWYVVGKTFDSLVADVAKVDGYNLPSVALAIWLLAEPKKGESNYDWLTAQVASGMGVKAEASSIDEKMKVCCDGRFEFIASVPCAAVDQFVNLELRAYACRNERMSGLNR